MANIFLARWLTAQDYGAYAVCWSILLVLVAIHNALILEPMTVLGPSDYGQTLDLYLKSVRRLNWPVAAALLLAGCAAALLYKQPGVRIPLIVMALSLPGYLLLLMARRRQYILNQPLHAFYFSLGFAALVFGWLSGWRAAGRLSAAIAAASFGLAWIIGLPANPRGLNPTPDLHDLARKHWRYGKWLFASAILAVGVSDLQTLLLSLLVDLKSAGALRALLNFILPLSQLLTVLSVYSLPKLSARARQIDRPRFLQSSLFFPSLMLTIAAAYVAAVWLFSWPLEHLLYGGKLHDYLYLVPLLMASALASALGASLSTVLRAVQNSAHQFAAGIAATAVGLTSAALFRKSFDLSDALWSMLAANLASTLIIAGSYLWQMRGKPQAAPA